MKKVIILILLLLSFASAANAANFMEIMRDDRFLIYIDTESIQDKDSYCSVWEKWIPRGKEATEIKKELKGDVDYWMRLTAHKKDAKESQTLAMYVYMKNGRIKEFVSSNTPLSFKWKPIIPGSVAEEIYDLIMHAIGY